MPSFKEVVLTFLAVIPFCVAFAYALVTQPI